MGDAGVSIYLTYNKDNGIVFGVARLEPCSNSASAGVRPGGIEALQTIPSFSGFTKSLALGEEVDRYFFISLLSKDSTTFWSPPEREE